MARLHILVVLLLFTGASLAPEAAHAEGLGVLTERMTGSFSSAAQAEVDQSYFDIRLEMVRIWPERTDGVWLYVEQAAASRLDQPYRQRVYRLSSPEDSVFTSEVYTFEDPLRFAGQWRKEKPLPGLSPDSFSWRDGCTVVMRWSGGAFVGGTMGTHCESKLSGASYATSEVSVEKDRIVSWDRGFDADGNQVWGAEKGGYIFLRVEKE